MIVAATVVGLEDIKRRLLEWSALTSGSALQMIIEPRVRMIRDMMSAKAPIGKGPRDPHPGRLRAGVVVVYLRGGVGYSKWAITLTKLAYYGLFQELGLGGKISARVQKRYTQYAYSKGIQKGLKKRGVTPGQIEAAYWAYPRRGGFGLNRKELSRQHILAEGRRLQGGGRRRNMAAQPFMRPIVAFVRQWFIDGVRSDVWAGILAHSAGLAK